MWLGIGGSAVGGVDPGAAGMAGCVPVAGGGEALLAAVDEWLAGRAAPCRVLNALVSDRHLRYVHLPWHDDVLGAQEDAILCRARFDAVYGDMEGWLVQAGRRRYGHGRIACAMPAWLADGLAQAAARHGARIGALTPQFAMCWNRWRSRFGRAGGMLAVADGSHLLLGTFGADGWQGLRSHFLVPHPQALAVAVRREKLRLGLPPDMPVWQAGFAGGMPQPVPHA